MLIYAILQIDYSNILFSCPILLNHQIMLTDLLQGQTEALMLLLGSLHSFPVVWILLSKLPSCLSPQSMRGISSTSTSSAMKESDALSYTASVI